MPVTEASGRPSCQTIQVEGADIWIGNNGAEFAAGVRAGYLLIGTSQGAVARVLRSISGKAPGLASQPLFREARDRVGFPDGGFVYYPLARLVGAIPPSLMSEAPAGGPVLKALADVPYFAAGFHADRTRGFVKVEGASGNPVVSALLKPPAKFVDLSVYFPDSCHAFATINVPYAVSLGEAATGSSLQDLLRQAGLSLGDIEGASPGGTVAVGADLTETIESRGARLPAFLAALDVKDASAADEIARRIATALGFGDNAPAGDVAGVSVQTGVVGLGLPVAWAAAKSPQPALLVAVGANAQNRNEQALRRSPGQQGSMAAVPAWRDCAREAGSDVVASAWINAGDIVRGVAQQIRKNSAGDVSVSGPVADFLEGRSWPAGGFFLHVSPDGLHYVGTNCVAPLALIGGAVLVPNFVRARAQGQVTACKSNLKNIGTALEMYSTDHSGRFPASLSQLTPNYLKVIPTCPAAGADTYSAGFVSASNPDAYLVTCTGHHHQQVGLDAGFPQYNSNYGLVEGPGYASMAPPVSGPAPVAPYRMDPIPQPAPTSPPADPQAFLDRYYQLISARNMSEAYALRSRHSHESSSFGEFEGVWSNNHWIRLDRSTVTLQSSERALVDVRLLANDTDRSTGVTKTTAWQGSVRLVYEDGNWRYDGGDFKAEH